MRKKWNEMPGGADNIYGIKGKSAAQKAESKYFGDSTDKITHSRYYHRYFRGYTEVRIPAPEHKYKNYKIQRFYTAPYIAADMDRLVYFYLVLSYILLAALAVFCFLHALLNRGVAGNSSAIVAIPGFPTVIALFLLCASVIAYVFRPKKMTLYEHETSTARLKTTAAISAGGAAATALMSAVYLLFRGSADLPAELWTIAQLLLSAAAAFAIRRLERSLRYKELPNDTKLPQGETHKIL